MKKFAFALLVFCLIACTSKKVQRAVPALAPFAPPEARAQASKTGQWSNPTNPKTGQPWQAGDEVITLVKAVGHVYGTNPSPYWERLWWHAQGYGIPGRTYVIEVYVWIDGDEELNGEYLFAVRQVTAINDIDSPAWHGVWIVDGFANDQEVSPDPPTTDGDDWVPFVDIQTGWSIKVRMWSPTVNDYVYESGWVDTGRLIDMRQ